MPQIGDLALDFTLPNQDGQPVTLSAFKGRFVILFAFPAAGTYGCTQQACSFREAFPRFAEANAVILGVSADSQDKLQKWKAKEKLPYDLLSDPDHRVLALYEAWGMKLFGVLPLSMPIRSYWVIDPQGRIVDLEINTGMLSSMEKALKTVTALSGAGREA